MLNIDTTHHHMYIHKNIISWLFSQNQEMSSEEPNDMMPKVNLRSDVEIVEKFFFADGTTGTYI